MQHKIIIKVGETRHGQPVEVVKDYDGNYTIVKHAANQRDETVVMTDLDRSIIENIAKAIQFNAWDDE